MSFLNKVLTASVFVLGASSAACSAGVVAGVPAGEEPVTETQPPNDPPATPDSPAKLRVAHMWEGDGAVDVCILGNGDTGEGIRPVYRSQGVAADKQIGGVPRYQVGRYIRLEPGARHVKMVAGDAVDCAAPAIVSTDLTLAEGTAFTVVLWGEDPAMPQTSTFEDKRTPAQKAETVRFYDFALDGSKDRKTAFENVPLSDFRARPEDVTLVPNQIGAFSHSISSDSGEKTAVSNHETRELGIVTVFAVGVIKNDTFRILVCDDDQRAVGPLTDCR